MMRRLRSLPFNREDCVFVGDEPPDGITKKKPVGNLEHVRATLDLLLGLVLTARSRAGWFGVGVRHHWQFNQRAGR